MTLLTNIPDKKIVLLGLAESGKSTIIKSVIQGETAELGERYDATINYQRKTLYLCGLEISIFDLGGQTRFLDKFTGDLAQFVFSNVDAFIFVIEPLQAALFSRSKYYFELSLEKLNLFSPNAEIFVFLHKSDLILEHNLNSISKDLQKYLTSEISCQIQYYNTSVFSESAYEAVGAVLSQLLNLKEEFSKICFDFIHKQLKSVIEIHLLSHEGAFLLHTLNKKQERPIPLKEIRKYFNLALKQNTPSNMDNTMISVEGKNYVYLANFLERGLAILSVISKDLLVENSDLSPEIYNNVLKLANDLNLKSSSIQKEGNQN
jgi:GTPase SAR1 family protein